MTVGVLLLAGGSSSRFGGDKRLAQAGDGRTLLDICIDTISRAGLPLLVCLRHDDHELEARLLATQIPCLRCPHSAAGMGHTLADGAGALPESWQGVLISLADMPLIQPETYHRLADALRPGTMVVPACNGQRGHPVGFGRDYFAELAQLAGDRGARDLLASNASTVIQLAVDDPGIHADVDTPADKENLCLP